MQRLKTPAELGESIKEAFRCGRALNSDFDNIDRLVALATPSPARAEAVPAGWKLVPVEPTTEMRNAFHAVTDSEALTLGVAGSRWAAMLAASPAEPARVQGEPIKVLGRFATWVAHNIGHATYEQLRDRPEWHEVSNLLASAAKWPSEFSTKPPAAQGGAVPADVLEAAQSFVDNGYRGPLAYARRVFDWVAGQAGGAKGLKAGKKDAQGAVPLTEKRLEDFLAQFNEESQEQILRYALDHVVPRLKRAAHGITPPKGKT